jgi:hypothetical protein
MKRRFRQKTDVKPKNDPDMEKGTSSDTARENVDIDIVIKEIDKHLKPGKKK